MQVRVSSARYVLAVCALLLVTGMTFARFLDVGFAATDSLALVETSRFDSLAGAARLFRTPVMDGTRFVEGEVVYRPLPSLTFGLDFLVWGTNAVGYHLTNVLLHLVAVLGLVWLLRELGLAWWSAAAGAAVLALHPLVVASVPVIARRDSVLPVAAFTIAAAAFLASQRTCGRWRLAFSAVAVSFGGAALLSKESAFVALLLLAVLAAARAVGDGCPRAALGYAPLFGGLLALALVVLVLRSSVVRGLGGPAESAAFSHLDFDRYSQTLGAFTRDLLWPFAGLAPSTREVWPRLAGLVVLGLVAILPWLGRRYAAVGAAGLLWLIAFAAFCVVLRITTVAWLGYFALVGVALLVGAGLEGSLRCLVLARQSRPARPVLPRRVASMLLLLGVGLYAGSALSASPIVRDYPQWRIAGEVTERVSQALDACVAANPQARNVNLRALPSTFDDGQVETNLLGVTLLEDWTLDAALRLQVPGRPMQVRAVSYETLRRPGDSLRFECSGSGDTLEFTTVY